MSSASPLRVLPLGFKASGIPAKIKKSAKKDLALFYSLYPCTASAMLTSNQVKAAPLEVSRQHLKAGKVRALIVNSGNANCMTGKQGVRDAYAMAKGVADELSLKKEEVLVSSTGIIGRPLPMKKIKAAIPLLVQSLSSRGLRDAAEAMMTTDRFRKVVVKKFKLGQACVTISGVAKGAGMIAPKMKSATMLAYCVTDALIEKSSLATALQEAVDASFHSITIDNCMSTNDMVVAMANGQAKNKPIKRNSKEASIFTKVLKELCLELAKMIVRDAEGATKFIEIRVKGAAHEAEAKALAFSVANSNLFKCAMFGNDPNWGRIAAALGSVPSSLQWEKLDIYLNKRAVFKNGRPASFKDNRFLKGRSVLVDIDLKRGSSGACVYTSDLSYEYVRINAEYN